MTDHQDKLNRLNEKLESLLKKQIDFSREIHEMRLEMDKLKAAESKRQGEVGVETEQAVHPAREVVTWML